MSQPAEFNTTTLIVDDTSSLITYSAGWTQGFSGAGIGDDSSEYNKTKHGSSANGDTATFTFTGTSVAVYGSLGSFDVYGVPVSSYSVDGGSPSTYTAPIIEPGGFAVKQLFYQSPPLTAGQHQLVITNINGTAPSVYWLDFILYDPSKTTAPTTTSSSASPSVTSPAPTSTKAASSPTGAIVGGVIGGLVVLGLILAALYLFCRRTRNPKDVERTELFAEEFKSPMPEGAIVQPFLENNSRVNVMPLKQYENSAQASEARLQAVPAPVEASGSGSGSRPNHASTPSSTSLLTAGTSPNTLATSSIDALRPTVLHQDSGIRLATPIEVPPEYTQD